MRATGTSSWHGLPTERQGSLLVARVDDERFRRGAYEFRAHAVDQAGNESSTGRRIDGSVATLRLPARTDTRLAVGVPRVIVRRKVEHHRGHRRLVRRRIRRLDSTVVVRAGRLVRLNGFLATASGQPIEGATIEALEKHPGGALTPIGVATTGTDGKFHYTVKAGAEPRHAVPIWRFESCRSRHVRLHDARARRHVDPSRSRSFAEWCNRSLFRGRVLTRPLPRQGKLIEMQAYFRGRWRTFSTVRANHSGRWRFPYRFGGTVGRVTYRFRARLPCRRRLPVCQRQLTRRQGRCTWTLTRPRARCPAWKDPAGSTNVGNCAEFISKALVLLERDGHRGAVHRTRWDLIRRDPGRQRRCRGQQSSQRRPAKQQRAKQGHSGSNAAGARPETERPRRWSCEGERARTGPAGCERGAGRGNIRFGPARSLSRRHDRSSGRVHRAGRAPGRWLLRGDRAPATTLVEASRQCLSWTVSLVRARSARQGNGPPASTEIPTTDADPFDQLEAVVLTGGGVVSYDRVYLAVQHAFRCVALPSN